MTDIDRGAYAPQTDSPLTFDARTPRSQRRGPAPFTLIFSALVLVALVGAVWMFYRGGVREAGEAPPVVGESVVAMREAAPVETAPADPAESLDVYVDEAEVTEAVPLDQPSFAPPPEQPQPRPAPKPAPAPVQVAQAPAPKPAAAPAPASAAPLRPAQPAVAGQAKPAPVQTAQAPAPVAPKPAAPAPAAVPAQTAAATSGAWGVQIGAFTSTAIADEQFNQVVGANPSYATGKAKVVQPVQKGASTLYRTIVSGFSREQAAAFCAQLKAQGRDCIVKGAA